MLYKKDLSQEDVKKYNEFIRNGPEFRKFLVTFLRHPNKKKADLFSVLINNSKDFVVKNIKTDEILLNNLVNCLFIEDENKLAFLQRLHQEKIFEGFQRRTAFLLESPKFNTITEEISMQKIPLFYLKETFLNPEMMIKLAAYEKFWEYGGVVPMSFIKIIQSLNKESMLQPFIDSYLQEHYPGMKINLSGVVSCQFKILVRNMVKANPKKFSGFINYRGDFQLTRSEKIMDILDEEQLAELCYHNATLIEKIKPNKRKGIIAAAAVEKSAEALLLIPKEHRTLDLYKKAVLNSKTILKKIPLNIQKQLKREIVKKSFRDQKVYNYTHKKLTEKEA